MQAPRFRPAKPGEILQIAGFSGLATEGYRSQMSIEVGPAVLSASDLRDELLTQMSSKNQHTVAMSSVEVSGREALLYAYEVPVPMEPRVMRSIALMVLAPNHTIRITASARWSDFKALEPEFRASLASLQLVDERSAK